MLNGSAFVDVSPVSAIHLPSTSPGVNALIIGGTLVAATALCSALVKYTVFQSTNSSKLPVLHGTPIFGHWRFFSERYDFINDGLKKLKSWAFQFYVLNHRVIVVSGDQGRKAFLNTPSLSFIEGYKVLHGSAPNVEDINVHADNANNAENVWFSKRVLSILRKERLEKVLPEVFDDLDGLMKPWGDHGRFDPLDDIYKMVFQLTARVGGCSELANDPVKLNKLTQEFWNIEKAVDATSMLLKWFPGKGRQSKKNATKAIYGILKEILDERRASGKPEFDAMQALIDEGCSDTDIIQFIMTTLFAGVVNTGIMSAWMIMYLGTCPEWKKKVTSEIQSFIAKYTGSIEDNTENSKPSIASILSRIPSSAWEDEMPSTDLCLRETIRLVQSSVFLRRNVSDEFSIGDIKVGNGDFVVYPSADVHHNPDVYSDPLKFDPERYDRKEDRVRPMAYVGWGAGRHPCLGMRFAKLEVKCIMAMFFASYDYEVVDESNEVMSTLPVPDRNNLFERTKRPNGKPIYVKYKRINA